MLSVDGFIGKGCLKLQRIATLLQQTSNISSLAGQCKRPHADYLCNPVNNQQHRVDRQNAPEEEEAFQLSAGRSCAPMRHLNLLPVGYPS